MTKYQVMTSAQTFAYMSVEAESAEEAERIAESIPFNSEWSYDTDWSSADTLEVREEEE